MTHHDYIKRGAQLRRAVLRTKANLLKPMTLADKLVVKSNLAKAHEALRQHLLNRFDLVTE